MMKKIFMAALILFVFLFSVSSVFAAGQLIMLDPYTGEVLSGDGDTSNQTVVNLGSGCTYDKTKDVYTYRTTTDDSGNVMVSVCSGMVVTDEVYIDAGESANISVFKDGEEMLSSEYSVIKDPGFYSVRDNLTDSELLRFTIVNRITSFITSYEVPSSFLVSSVNYNGESQLTGGNYVDLSREGSYEISYSGIETGKTYNLNVDIDRTPPQLNISGVVDGVARGPVTFGQFEEDSTVVMTRDGENIVFSEELKTAGDYTIVYTDAAGNSVTVFFTIQVYFDAAAWVYVGITAVLLIGAVVYMIRSHRNMRTC